MLPLSTHLFGALTGASARRRFVASIAGAALLGIVSALPSTAPRFHIPATLAASSGWLIEFNLWRATTGQSALTENATWSAGDYNHAVYMVKTGQVTHSEVAGPYYTAAGDIAAQNSNIFVSSSTTMTDEQSIDWWMSAPFHAMAMVDPRLTQTGFGSYRDATGNPWKMGAALDVGRGNPYTGGTWPVFFPGDKSTMPLTAYSGNESPDPQSACPGYTGLPVFVEVGGNVSTTATVHTITANGTLLDTCTIDSTNATLGASLKYRGGVIIMPRSPLAAGVTYVVALTVNALPYTWSFSVGPFSSPGAPPPTGWKSLGGGLTSSPDASSASATSTDVFVRGTDNQMWMTHWDGTKFGNYVPAGGVLTAKPGAIAASATRTDVFVRGSDNQLWMKESNTGTFGNWTPLGGILTSGPDADSWTATGVHVDIYVRGNDNQLWHRWSDSGVFAGGWEPLGGVLTSDPGAVSWGPNRADVFVRGTDNQLWHKWYDGVAWRAWEPLGGSFSTGADAASCSATHLDVFAIGTDGQMWQLGNNGTAWTGWKSLGGSWTSRPSAVCSPGTTTISLFARGPDGALWTRSVTGS